jgi:hypothetical protein
VGIESTIPVLEWAETYKNINFSKFLRQYLKKEEVLGRMYGA